jgi:hypothetical protein
VLFIDEDDDCVKEEEEVLRDALFSFSSGRQ